MEDIYHYKKVMSRNEITPLKPVRLVSGDTIGVVAPAGTFDLEAFQLGVDILEKMGFQVYVPEALFEKERYLAGSDARRAELINLLFSDNTVKAIVCARGGFGSARILPLLDFDLIRNNLKIFVGFSDISVLLTVFLSKCGIITFHGPMVTTLGNADQESKDAMLYALTTATPIEIFPDKGVTIKKGIATGTLMGGNLSTLCHLVGTPYEPDLNGQILFIEDVNEEPYKIERMLFQMKLSGCLDGLSGLALGSFENCGSLDSIQMVMEKIFIDDEIPILGGFNIGHGNTNLTIPMGVSVTIDADRHMLKFHEAAVSEESN